MFEMADRADSQARHVQPHETAGGGTGQSIRIDELGRRSSSLARSELDRLQRPPHHLRELLVLGFLRRIQPDIHAAAIRQPGQQLIARGGPELIPQRMS